MNEKMELTNALKMLDEAGANVRIGKQKMQLGEALQLLEKAGADLKESCKPINDHGLGGAVSKKFKDKEWVTEISYPFSGFREDHSTVLIHTNTDDEKEAREHEGDVWLVMTNLYDESEISTRIKQEYEFEEEGYEDLAEDYRDKWVIVVKKESGDEGSEDDDESYDNGSDNDDEIGDWG